MAHTSKNKKYLISPYITSLSCVFLLLLIVANVKMFDIWLDKVGGLSGMKTLITADVFGMLLMPGLTLAAVLVLSRNGYEFFGSMEICSEWIVFRGVFKKPRVFMYEELKDVGIDYGTLSGTRQFWIYFSKKIIDKKYTHNILRLPFSPDTMRVQYRKTVYEALIKAVPYKSIGKTLCRSHTVVKLFHVDQ